MVVQEGQSFHNLMVSKHNASSVFLNLTNFNRSEHSHSRGLCEGNVFKETPRLEQNV